MGLLVLDHELTTKHECIHIDILIRSNIVKDYDMHVMQASSHIGWKNSYHRRLF